MTVPPWLWVVFTLVAATAQTFRNATQRSLTERARHRRRDPCPLPLRPALRPDRARSWSGADRRAAARPTVASLGLGGARRGQPDRRDRLMLAAMRERSFVVTTAYTKTEPVQVALFAVVFLGEHVSLALAVAILVATAGVLVLSWPSRAGGEVFSWRPAVLGIASGGLFALAAVGFRGAIVALGDADYRAGRDRDAWPSRWPSRPCCSPAGCIVRDPAVLCAQSSSPGGRRCRPASSAPSPRRCGSSPSPSKDAGARCAPSGWSRS